jgi:hypothetical protein
MKKVLLFVASIAIGFMLFSFTQQTNEKNLVVIRIFENCKGCTGSGAKIVISGDGAEKITPLEKYDTKNPETTTNLELIRYTLRQYVNEGYRITASTAIYSIAGEITTYVLIKE